MTRYFGRCLFLGGPDILRDMIEVAKNLLTEQELASFAYVFLEAARPDLAEIVVERVFKSAGCPLPTLLNLMDSARWWASLASQAERDDYMLAAYEASHKDRQMAFLDFVQRRRAA